MIVHIFLLVPVFWMAFSRAGSFITWTRNVYFSFVLKTRKPRCCGTIMSPFKSWTRTLWFESCLTTLVTKVMSSIVRWATNFLNIPLERRSLLPKTVSEGHLNVWSILLVQKKSTVEKFPSSGLFKEFRWSWSFGIVKDRQDVVKRSRENKACCPTFHFSTLQVKYLWEICHRGIGHLFVSHNPRYNHDPFFSSQTQFWKPTGPFGQPTFGNDPSFGQRGGFGNVPFYGEYGHSTACGNIRPFVQSASFGTAQNAKAKVDVSLVNSESPKETLPVAPTESHQDGLSIASSDTIPNPPSLDENAIVTKSSSR